MRVVAFGEGMSKNKRVAFITGITGQDGAYLAEFLLGNGYDVHGLVRWDSYVDNASGTQRLNILGIINNVTLHTGDINDAQSLTYIIKKVKPDEIYNLAALSQVGVSFDTPASTFDINVKGTLALLDAVRILDIEETVRIYQASSSEIFGCAAAPQNEDTPMHPCSPYGVAKLAAYWLVRSYRDSYGIFAVNGILFNHESPLRGEDFVTRKITNAIADIVINNGEQLLALGNLDSVRDWGHARDYVRGMWMMLQHDKADDYVLATGNGKSVREFVEQAFAHVGINIKWRGVALNEVGYNTKNNKTLICVDEHLFRPKDVNYLLGDASKAHKILGWNHYYDFDALVAEMMDEDISILQNKKQKQKKSGNLKDVNKWRKAG